MRRHGNASLLGVALALLVLAAGDVSAQGSDEPVSLDKLLQIPSGAPVGQIEVEKRGGRTRRKWQDRYRTTRQDIAKAEKNLGKSRELLQKRMSEETGQWKMAAPGIGDAAQTADAPTDYGLTQRLRRDRDELARAERALQDLDVEANLAGVPEDWRKDAAAVAQ